MCDSSTQREATEHPILFNGEMVRAILDGRKTQTRRVVSPRNSTVLGYPGSTFWSHLRWDYQEPRVDRGPHMLAGDYEYLHVPAWHPEDDEEDVAWYRVRPIWEAGDRLWVRETWQQVIPLSDDKWTTCELIEPMRDGRLLYAATIDEEEPPKWRPSIHMPRWASRVKLEVTAVRVERLQDITEADAQAEGVERPVLSEGPTFKSGGMTFGTHPMTGHYVDGFRELWDQLNAKRGFNWESNPWVWVRSFKRCSAIATPPESGNNGNQPTQ